jgi:serine protease inhibitor
MHLNISTFVSAGNPSTRSGLPKFVADHPFLYFVRDTEDNIIVVAGKVIDPSNLRTSV